MESSPYNHLDRKLRAARVLAHTFFEHFPMGVSSRSTHFVEVSERVQELLDATDPDYVPTFHEVDTTQVSYDVHDYPHWDESGQE